MNKYDRMSLAQELLARGMPRTEMVQSEQGKLQVVVT
jgi:hypothetical protein